MSVLLPGLILGAIIVAVILVALAWSEWTAPPK